MTHIYIHTYIIPLFARSLSRIVSTPAAIYIVPLIFALLT